MKLEESYAPTTHDLSAHDNAIAPFLAPGEQFHSNYGLNPSSLSLPLDEYIIQLQTSGNFASVRTSEEAVFDNEGRPYQGAVAIFVIPNPVTPTPQA